MSRTSEIKSGISKRVFSKYTSAYRFNAGKDSGVTEGLTTMSKTQIQDGIYTTTTKRTVYPGGRGTEVTVGPQGQRTVEKIQLKGPQSWAYDKPKTNTRR